MQHRIDQPCHALQAVPVVQVAQQWNDASLAQLCKTGGIAD